MLIFLYGEDSFRSYQKLQEIIKKYQEKYPDGLNLYQVKLGPEHSASQADIYLKSSSLFREKKLIILREAFALKANEQKKLIQALKSQGIEQDKDSVLVFWERGKIDARTALFKHLTKHGRSQKFNNLKRGQASLWIKKTLSQHFPSCKMPDSLINFLADRLAPDLWRIYQELIKINDFQQANKNKPLTKQALKTLIAFPPDSNIFRTLDAIALKHQKQALWSLAEHFKASEPELKILAMFEFQFRTLIKVKALIEKRLDYYAIQRQAKLKPYVLRKTFSLANNFSMQDLKEAYNSLFELDLGFKTGKIQDKQIALEMFIVKLCTSK